MAIKIISTKNYAFDAVKCLVYSPAGIGKTVLCSTAPSPFIISAEAGLLSLSGMDIPATEVTTVAQVEDALKWCQTSKEASQYRTICLDSITEIAEVLLIEYKAQEKDPRAAYGRMNDDVARLIRSFRDLKGKHVYFTAKQLKMVDDDSGRVSYHPGMPGKTLLYGLPFFFDEVFILKIGRLADKSLFRYLQTYPDLQYDAKDRSGKMLPKSKPDLTTTFNIIMGKEDPRPKLEPVKENETKTETKPNEKELKNGTTTKSG